MRISTWCRKRRSRKVARADRRSATRSRTRRPRAANARAGAAPRNFGHPRSSARGGAPGWIVQAATATGSSWQAAQYFVAAGAGAHRRRPTVCTWWVLPGQTAVPGSTAGKRARLSAPPSRGGGGCYHISRDGEFDRPLLQREHRPARPQVQKSKRPIRTTHRTVHAHIDQWLDDVYVVQFHTAPGPADD